MNKKQIARKYSKVLLSTVEVARIPNVIENFKAFSKLFDTDKRLKVLFISQTFSEGEKSSVLKSLLSRLDTTPESEKLLRLIIMQGHLPAMKEIIQASLAAYNEKLKKMTALVISPVPLDTKHVERLKESIKNFTQREIEIENQIDPSLLGGFIVKAGSTIFDSSLKGQLRLLKTELMR
jgi:ATP synthase F1 delta subunit